MQVQRTLSGRTDIKNNSDRYYVQDNSGDQLLGSLYINRAKLVWCNGKTALQNSKTIKWEDFIAYMDSLK